MDRGRGGSWGKGEGGGSRDGDDGRRGRYSSNVGDGRRGISPLREPSRSSRHQHSTGTSTTSHPHSSQHSAEQQSHGRHGDRGGGYHHQHRDTQQQPYSSRGRDNRGRETDNGGGRRAREERPMADRRGRERSRWGF